MELHQRAMLEHNTVALKVGPQHADCVDGKIGNAWQSELYVSDEDAKKGICFAGFLLFYLTMGNCFPDGNKRIGWIAAMTVLSEVGLTVKATDEEAEAFVTKIAAGLIRSGLEVVNWIAGRLDAPDPGSMELVNIGSGATI
jgi:prophage maintenance system killer protein